jgi:SNF2 family DNA or RNA helicase
MLDLIAIALNIEQMKFCRYDGSLSLRQRDESVRCFRADPEINILLISIGSGAVG